MSRTCFLPVLVLVLMAISVKAQTATPATRTEPVPQDSSQSLFLVAADAGGGWSTTAPRSPRAQAGIKIGMELLPLGGKSQDFSFRTVTLDLAYDRISGRSGFSTEGSLMLPLFRYPKPSSDESRNFLRVYAEPGVGRRAGDGAFGAYSSAKVMFVLLSDKRLGLEGASPFVEVQRRFPFNSPLRGDTRITFGVMVALCNGCGLD